MAPCPAIRFNLSLSRKDFRYYPGRGLNSNNTRLLIYFNAHKFIICIDTFFTFRILVRTGESLCKKYLVSLFWELPLQDVLY